MAAVPDITARPDRRRLICESALELAAAGGNRAVTHTAIDRALALPKGSTSYYFRTRYALLEATLTHLTELSRTEFERLLSAAATDPVPVIGAYLHDLTTRRIRDVRARFALAPDAAQSPDLAAALADCLFSPTAARALFADHDSRAPEGSTPDAPALDPDAAARDLLTYCEGVVARACFTGPPPKQTSDGVREQITALRRCLSHLA